MKWLALVVVFGCEHETHEAKPPPHPTAIACEHDSDCPLLPRAATCSYTCADTCRLAVVETKVGAGPCSGYKRDGVSLVAIPRDAPVLVECDVNAGVYCESSTKRCAPIKPRGAACSDDAECGDDGRCADQRCAPGIALGESCYHTSCAKGLVCDAEDRCAPRRTTGVQCGLDDDCVSLQCANGHCAAPVASIACPVSH